MFKTASPKPISLSEIKGLMNIHNNKGLSKEAFCPKGGSVQGVDGI